ncbi:MAG: GTPase family protein [Pseudomonas sp.]
MSILKYLKHKGAIEELSTRYRDFDKFKRAAGAGWHKWVNQKTGEETYDKMVLFIGKSGYGKSSTVNALIGRNVLETSDVEACTRVCQCVDFQVSDDRWLSIGDLPGLGENMAKDVEYFKLYSDFFGYASAIVHVLRADARDYSADEHLTDQFFKNSALGSKVIYAIGQCDKVEPLSRSESGAPTPAQQLNIARKIEDVESIFEPINPVIAYSAHTGWNLSVLVDRVVSTALAS